MRLTKAVVLTDIVDRHSDQLALITPITAWTIANPGASTTRWSCLAHKLTSRVTKRRIQDLFAPGDGTGTFVARVFQWNARSAWLAANMPPNREQHQACGTSASVVGRNVRKGSRTAPSQQITLVLGTRLAATLAQRYRLPYRVRSRLQELYPAPPPLARGTNEDCGYAERRLLRRVNLTKPSRALKEGRLDPDDLDMQPLGSATRALSGSDEMAPDRADAAPRSQPSRTRPSRRASDSSGVVL